MPDDQKQMSAEEEEILKFIQESRPKIYVVGTGGSGCNTLTRLAELGIEGATLVAMNTDAQHLLHTKADKKVLLGKKLTRGLGAGSDPKVGEEAAKESIEEIKQALTDASMVFVTCGLGGGTGTGSAHVIAQAAKDMGALTIGVVTLPFSSEGKIRHQNALDGLTKLKRQVDTLIVIKNDKLLSVAPDLPLKTAFKISDEILAGSVKGITELITKPGEVNVDFADLRTVLSNAGWGVVGIGESSVEASPDERALVAVETALNSPLLDVDISGATKALVNIVGGEDMTMKEAETIVSEVANRISPEAHIIWGARIEDNQQKSNIKVLVVLGGVKFGETRSKQSLPIDLEVIG